jgi:hypothetical protein
MGLDINTPKGQKSLQQMYDAARIYEQETRRVILLTDMKSDSVVDGMIVDLESLKMEALAEIKCREMTYEELRAHGSWLITYSKLENGRKLAAQLRIAFYGILYLVPDKKVLVWKISDAKGKYLFDFKKEKTRTRATINGGWATRENAFLPIEYAVIINNHEEPQ